MASRNEQGDSKNPQPRGWKSKAGQSHSKKSETKITPNLFPGRSQSQPVGEDELRHRFFTFSEPTPEKLFRPAELMPLRGCKKLARQHDFLDCGHPKVNRCFIRHILDGIGFGQGVWNKVAWLGEHPLPEFERAFQ